MLREAAADPDFAAIMERLIREIEDKLPKDLRDKLRKSDALAALSDDARALDAVIKLYNGQSVPVRDVVPTVPMTAELLEKFYPKKDGVWAPDFAAIAASVESRDVIIARQ